MESTYIEEIITNSKMSKRIYYLVQLKCANIQLKDLVLYSMLHALNPLSIMELRAVFHHSLPKYLSNKLERLQKRSIKILIYPSLKYEEALNICGVPT
jgi:hypothetical protein